MHLATDLFRRSQYPKRVFAEDLADISFGVSLLEKSVCDLREVGNVLHSVRHEGAIEVRAETHVIGANEFDGVVGKETERGWEQAEDISTLLPSLRR